MGAGCLPLDMDKGQVAKWVSNASFATLTLIFSFTQLLDLANQCSTLVGVTLRGGQLLQVLHLLPWVLHLLQYLHRDATAITTCVIVSYLANNAGHV